MMEDTAENGIGGEASKRDGGVLTIRLDDVIQESLKVEIEHI